MPIPRASLLLLALPLLTACGGTTCPCQCPADSPLSASAPTPTPTSDSDSDSDSEPEPEPEPTPAPAPALAPPPAPAPAPAPPTLTFPPNATVEQAITAVPQGLPRLNMSQDALEQPVVDPTKYAACAVPASVHFKVRAAVFDGRAVGVDVETKPKSKRVEACIADIVRAMSWQRVPSLNTVTVSF